MVFKKGQSKFKSNKELTDLLQLQIKINDSHNEVVQRLGSEVAELNELGERLERTDWALLDYIKQQEHVLQSMERRLYNIEKTIVHFASQAPEAQ